MEYGPRALGNRSILADPRDAGMQSRLNLKIKFRESFRPFAPALPAEQVRAWFELDRESPYMLLVAQAAGRQAAALPAVTHVDGSARVQTVSAARNPRFHALLRAFERRTGCPVLVNTSFNVRGEPIVCGPEDAFRCFMKTGMDHLVMGGWLLHKVEQPPLREPDPAATPPTGPRRWPAALAARFAPIGRAWLALSERLGRLNAGVVFGAVYLAMVVPYGIAHRLLGRVPLSLGFDRTAPSYRVSSRDKEARGMDHPY